MWVHLFVVDGNLIKNITKCHILIEGIVIKLPRNVNLQVGMWGIIKIYVCACVRACTCVWGGGGGVERHRYVRAIILLAAVTPMPQNKAKSIAATKYMF
jgi:hypothetical protein